MSATQSQGGMAACGMELRRSARKQEKVQEKGNSPATVKTVQLRSCRGNGSVAGQFTRSGRSKKEIDYKESSSSSSHSESETMEIPVQRTISKSHMDKATTSHRKGTLGAGDVVKLISTADLSSDSSDDGIMEAMWLLSGKDKTSSRQRQGGKRDAEQKSEECMRKRRGCVVKAKHFTFKRLRNCSILEKQESNSKIDNTVPRLEKEVQKEEEEEEEKEETGSELSEDSIEEEEMEEEEETGSGELSEECIEEEEKEEETGGRELNEECIEEEEKEKEEVEVKEHVCVWSKREELSSMLPGRQAQVRILLELIGEVINMVQSQKHVVMCCFVPFPFTVMAYFSKDLNFANCCKIGFHGSIFCKILSNFCVRYKFFKKNFFNFCKLWWGL